MRIVSSKSDKEVIQQRARMALDYPLRALSANLLRIVRGAGKPNRLEPQMSVLIDRCAAYRDVFGHWPTDNAITTTVAVSRTRSVADWIASFRQDIDEASVDRWLRDGTYDLDKAVDKIVRAALQLAASRLLAQRTQEITARHDLFEAVRSLEEARQKHLAALGIAPRRGSRKSNRAKPMPKKSPSS